MCKIKIRFMLFVSLMLISFTILCCSPTEPEHEPPLTRLYLRGIGERELSITPETLSGLSGQAFVWSSRDWKTTLASDMIGTKCKFGILFALRIAISSAWIEKLVGFVSHLTKNFLL